MDVGCCRCYNPWLHCVDGNPWFCSVLMGPVHVTKFSKLSDLVMLCLIFLFLKVPFFVSNIMVLNAVLESNLYISCLYIFDKSKNDFQHVTVTFFLFILFFLSVLFLKCDMLMSVQNFTSDSFAYNVSTFFLFLKLSIIFIDCAQRVVSFFIFHRYLWQITHLMGDGTTFFKSNVCKKDYKYK